ncbi:MAG: flagellar hook-associated protein FlgK [Rhodospirillales bacterium 12-54-5]|nr:MAG: flagellar hook-associated protein FlgK [Rhodospirillales bacterium 12-54-5]
MSLNTAFSIAQKGINSLEQQISVISNNINNANKAGYTRKTFAPETITAAGYSIPAGGKALQAVVNDALATQVNTQATNAQYNTTIASYLSAYSDSYGSTSGNSTTLSATLDNLATAFQSLESDPTQLADKSAIVANAQQLAAGLNGLSSGIQKQRQQASDAIGTAVTTINDNLQTIYDLNKQIVNATATGLSAPDLIDQRNVALNNLSQQIGVQYSSTSDNQLDVFIGGVPVLQGARIYKLSYTPAGGVSSSTVYPGGFSGITIGGTDITTSATTGTIGALISLRDSTLPGEQSKLDAFASTLASTVNKVLADGTAYPPENSISGTTAVTSATALSATGNWRVAVTDTTGKVVNTTDLNLASYSTVGALVTALNGLTGVSASVASGVLTITSTTTTNGISLNQLTSSIGGKGATQYFGFNNLFTGSTTGTVTASNIGINSTLLTNSSALASSTLSSSGTLAAGNIGLTSADTTISTRLVDAFNTAQSFVAAGNFSSQTTTIGEYASSLIADAASKANSSKTSADTAKSTYTYLSTQLSSETGVNIDEESANLSALQNYYSSTAQVLSVIKELYTTLLAAYR